MNGMRKRKVLGIKGWQLDGKGGRREGGGWKYHFVVDWKLDSLDCVSFNKNNCLLSCAGDTSCVVKCTRRRRLGTDKEGVVSIRNTFGNILHFSLSSFALLTTHLIFVVYVRASCTLTTPLFSSSFSFFHFFSSSHSLSFNFIFITFFFL